MTKEQRLKAFAKFVNHVIAASMALYELVTGEQPPKLRDILKG